MKWCDVLVISIKAGLAVALIQMGVDLLLSAIKEAQDNE